LDAAEHLPPWSHGQRYADAIRQAGAEQDVCERLAFNTRRTPLAARCGGRRPRRSSACAACR
jgi:hypothetical protein